MDAPSEALKSLTLVVEELINTFFHQNPLRTALQRGPRLPRMDAAGGMYCIPYPLLAKGKASVSVAVPYTSPTKINDSLAEAPTCRHSDTHFPL